MLPDKLLMGQMGTCNKSLAATLFGHPHRLWFKVALGAALRVTTVQLLLMLKEISASNPSLRRHTAHHCLVQEQEVAGHTATAVRTQRMDRKWRWSPARYHLLNGLQPFTKFHQLRIECSNTRACGGCTQTITMTNVSKVSAVQRPSSRFYIFLFHFVLSTLEILKLLFKYNHWQCEAV